MEKVPPLGTILRRVKYSRDKSKGYIPHSQVVYNHHTPPFYRGFLGFLIWIPPPAEVEGALRITQRWLTSLISPFTTGTPQVITQLEEAVRADRPVEAIQLANPGAPRTALGQRAEATEPALRIGNLPPPIPMVEEMNPVTHGNPASVVDHPPTAGTPANQPAHTAAGQRPQGIPHGFRM